jgi:hypothetical protein
VNNLTWGVGEPVSGPLVAPLDESGDTCLWQSTDARLSVQMVGVFAPSAGYAYLRNSRTLSTLTGTSTNTVTIVPDTVTPTTVLAHISGAAGTAPINYSVFTCGTHPSAPSVTTFVRGSATTLALLRTGTDGSVCVRSSGGGKVAITVVGTFDDSSAAAAARQVFDSRAPITAALSTPVQVAGVGSLPAVGTLTGALVSTIAWFPSDPGALTAGQCPASSGSPRLTPLEPHHPRSAAVFAPIDAATGRFCIRSSVPSRVSINVVGTFGTGFTSVAARLLRNG